MRIRVGTRRYSSSNGANGMVFGIFLIMFGLMFALSTISMSCSSAMFKKTLPQGTKEYDAYITEVLSVEGNKVRVEDSDGDSYIEYKCDSRVVLQYEIDGETYTKTHTFKEWDEACEVGEKVRLMINPNNPEKIYGYSMGSGENVLLIVEIVFGLIGVAIAVAGIMMIVKSKKKTKADNQQVPQMSQSYMGQNYNGQSFSGQNYNGQDYGVNSEYNYDSSVSQGTNYSGTSLRD